MSARRRLHYYCPSCHSHGWHHYGYYAPTPPPWRMGRPTPEEEAEALKEHIEMLKEELRSAEEELKEMEKPK